MAAPANARARLVKNDCRLKPRRSWRVEAARFPSASIFAQTNSRKFAGGSIISAASSVTQILLEQGEPAHALPLMETAGWSYRGLAMVLAGRPKLKPMRP